ncbi:hypothetical protein ACILG0_12175 [Pseudomonadota bacterium AL_CKDN230030165-1A_HGKHYDSX7]
MTPRSFSKALSAMLLTIAPPLMAQTTVQSLDGVRDAIRTQEGRDLRDSQMSGAPQPDGLGTALPAGFTKELLLRELAPAADPATLVLAGAKPWPARPGSYVAMVCLARTAKAAARALKVSRNDCSNVLGDGDERDVMLGVFEAKPGSAPRRIARTPDPIDTPTNWYDTNIDMPIRVDPREGQGAPLAEPEGWRRWDLARYEIRPGDVALGLRATWTEGYSGGGAAFEALYLFRIDGDALRPVFARPMAFTKDIAGNWNADGTRQHDVSDASNVLVMLPSKTHGYFDIKLSQKGGGDFGRVFKYKPATGMYE